LPHLPWVAVFGELVTAACVGFMGLFQVVADWISWPELLIAWHMAIVFIGSLAAAIGLLLRRSNALKSAIFLLTCVGFPNLVGLAQAFSQATTISHDQLTVVLYSLIAIGQLMVILSCLRQLAPAGSSTIQQDNQVDL